MSYTSRIQISETESELCCAYRKTKDLRTKLRIKALILFKEGNFQKQEDLALHLCIGYSTLRRWLKKYTDEGFEKYIREPVRGKPASLVTPEIHKALEDKLKDSYNPLQSYLDAVLWVKQTHGIEFKYHTLRKYMIKHFKTKLKVPRKSHHKKDEQAIEAFFKTAGYIK
jgi:transposase